MHNWCSQLIRYFALLEKRLRLDIIMHASALLFFFFFLNLEVGVSNSSLYGGIKCKITAKLCCNHASALHFGNKYMINDRT